MKLKCETILDIYRHKNKTILCQIKLKGLTKESRESKNTCRCLTREQWNAFDKELEKLVDCHNNDAVEWDDEKLCKFKVNPNIEVKVQKSKLSTKDFHNFLEEDANDGVGGNDESGADNNCEIIYILECIVDYIEQTLEETQEYEPEYNISPDNKLFSPATYEPYTPTKKKYRANSIETVKTPGIDLLGYESREDTYSPKPLLLSETSATTISDTSGISIIPEYNAAPSRTDYRATSIESLKTTAVGFLGYESTEDTYSPRPIVSSAISPTAISETSASSIIPEYKAAPIKDKPSSKDEVIVETEDELPENYRPIRSKKIKKLPTKRKEIEYIPKSQELTEAPAYIPTPIEDIKYKKEIEQKSDSKEETTSVVDKKEDYKKDKKDLKISEKEQLESKLYSKKSRYEDSKEKINKKLDYKEKISTRSKEKNIDLNEEKQKKNEQAVNKILQTTKTPSSSEDELDAVVRKMKDIKSKSSQTKSDNEVDSPNSKKSKEIIAENVSNITISSATDSVTTDTSPPKKKSKERHKKLSHHETASLRRSGRSPSKPKRLIEEQPRVENKKKTTTQKCSPTNKELFGTDDDDDNDFEKNNNDDKNNNAAIKIKSSLFQTPKMEKHNKPSSTSSSSTKKKRKRDKSSECEQEKRQMSNWLCKKKSNSDLGAAPSTSKGKSKSSSKPPPLKVSKKLKSSKVDKKRRSKSESPPPADFVMPTKDELEEIRIKTKLQLENNEKLKAELDKIAAPPPKQVENLCLKDMSVSDLLNTFDDHKSVLDEIYKNNNKKDHIKSHEGINHCFVIRLMETQTQCKMLDKLTDVYSNNNSTTQATLFANAMLPEWIIRIYMDKYKFTRREAIQQIKEQDDYQLHIDEQNESTFCFD